MVKRENVLRIVKSKLAKEELNLKAANTDYQKRLASHSIAILRDICYMVENMV